jgi:nucleotide-binding universal stress UspA family protein
VSEHLLDLAAADGADLLVIGTHKREGWSRFLHGSVSLEIVASARRNCVVVPLAQSSSPRAPERIERVLVPIDFSARSSSALEWAARLVVDRGTLHLVHVVAPYVPLAVEVGAYVASPMPTPEERKREQQAIERKLAEFAPRELRERGLAIETECVEGFDPAAQLAQAAQRCSAQLICMATHGRTGLSRALLGSIAQGVLKHSRVPVVVVPRYGK